MKKKRFMAVLLAALLVAAMLPSSVFAAEFNPADTAFGGEYYSKAHQWTIKNPVTSFADLEDVIAEYAGPLGQINSIEFYDLQTNDISELVYLGSSKSDTWEIPTLTLSTLGSCYPIKILPRYDAATKTYLHAHTLNTGININIPKDFLWRANVVYVYDKGRDNKVVIDHGVLSDFDDKLYEAMLQHADRYKIDGADAAWTSGDGNNIILKGLNAPTGTRSAEVYYDNVLNSETSQVDYSTSTFGKGSPFSISFSYKYYVAPAFYSTVAVKAKAELLGSIEIVKIDTKRNAVAGAKFRVYTDSDCTAEAERYNETSKAFEAVGELVSGADGKVAVSNLKAGTYYVKETEAPKGYDKDENAHAVTVAGGALDTSLSTTGGEGASLTINKEVTNLAPVWDQDGFDTSLPMNTDDTETVNASKYNGTVFFKAGGNTIALTSPNAMNGLTALSNAKYNLTVGSQSSSYDTLAEAIAYINSELIGNKLIDNEGYRDHVVIQSSQETVYYVDENADPASVTITNEFSPVNVIVSKSWFNDTPAQRPEKIYVQLFCDGEAMYNEEEIVPVELNFENEWTYTWEELEGGHEYTVDEINVPDNYVKTIETAEENIFNIKNTYVKESPKTGYNSMLIVCTVSAMIVGIYAALRLRKEN